jgi:hypothetical protein
MREGAMLKSKGRSGPAAANGSHAVFNSLSSGPAAGPNPPLRHRSGTSDRSMCIGPLVDCLVGREQQSRSLGEYIAVVGWHGNCHRVARRATELKWCRAFGGVDLLAECGL